MNIQRTRSNANGRGAVANSGLQKHAGPAAMRFKDSRSGTKAAPDPALKSGENASSQVAQLTVIVGDKPVKKVGEKKALIHDKLENLTETGMGWVEDRYTRTYEDSEEFKKHMNGQPVDVGLAKKLGRWYRLPYFSAKKFFVLGENHGAFGYRELMAESNQPGKVLGEGGSHPLMSMTPEKDIELNPGGLKQEEGLREGNMESMASKTMYALMPLKAEFEKLLKNGKSAGKSTKNFEAEEEWLAGYQAADPKDRKVGEGLDKIPFYLKEGGKYYAKTGSKAEDYGVLKTAIGLVNKFNNAMHQYAGDKSKYFESTQKHMEEFHKHMNADMPDYSILLKTFDLLMPNLEKLALEELTLMTDGNPELGLEKRHEAVAGNKDLTKWADEKKRAMAYRDYAMLLSVLKAKKDPSYVMAGMGDWHAQDLKDAEELKKADIPVVIFEDFYTKHSQDAIAPIHENEGHKTFLDKVSTSHDMYKGIADNLQGVMTDDEKKMDKYDGKDILAEMEVFDKTELNKPWEISVIFSKKAGISQEVLQQLERAQKEKLMSLVQLNKFPELIGQYRTLRGKYDGRNFLSEKSKQQEYTKGYKEGENEMILETAKNEVSPLIKSWLAEARETKNWDKIKAFCNQKNGKIALLRAGLNMEDLEIMDPGYQITFEEEYQTYHPTRSFFSRWSNHVFVRKRFKAEEPPKLQGNSKKKNK